MMNWFKHSESRPAATRNEVAIRMEAIGGQGANSAGKILSDAAVTGAGYTGCHFASFGSEKRGSPVQSFVRFSPMGAPMRSAFFTTSPDLIVVFHEAMLQMHPGSLAGATASTTLVVNSAKQPGDLFFPGGTSFGKIICVDAGAISRAKRCGINAVMLGAMSVAVPEVAQELVVASLEKFFGRLSSQARSRNVAGFKAALGHSHAAIFRNEQASLPPGATPLPRMGWVNAPMGGLITNPGNTVLRDHSLSRQGFAPRFEVRNCIQCGYCDMLCPDYCFVWDRSGENGAAALKGIDYQFCKGCQKCISVCPTGALSLSPENAIPEGERLRKFPDLDPEALERKWHSVDWNINYPDEEEEK